MWPTMKTFRTKNPAQLDELVLVLRQMGYVAHRSGIASVEAHVRSPCKRSRLIFGATTAAEHRAAS